MAAETQQKKTIIFFHPDLGIGGAERLIIDAAVGLQNRGHKVVIFTSHCDPKHCFDEARDGTLDVRVRGNTIVPPSLLGRFSILCAILRQLHLILQTYFSYELANLNPDAFIVDQLSAGLPCLRYMYPDARILFYCHFPDLLLARGRTNILKRLYRIPFDWVEQFSMSFADSVAVNSGFTKSIAAQTWPELVNSGRKEWEVIYPCVDTKEDNTIPIEDPESVMWHEKDILLSINRFERKKDVGLAIKAYAGLGKHGREGVRLVIAGGYDNRVSENVSYHKDLIALAESLGLKTATVKTVVTALNVPDDINVLFLLSVPKALKDQLLKSAKLLLYTPSNEHFGIVPLEAMLVGVPVLAANTGGPLETVVEGKTGWLRSTEDVDGWTDVMNNVLHKLPEKELKKMGSAGKKRVKAEFSETKMAERFEELIVGMENAPRRQCPEIALVFFTNFVIVSDVFSWFMRRLRTTAGAPEKKGLIPRLPPFTATVLSIVGWSIYLVVWFTKTAQARRAREAERKNS
ncbi:glycosyltransferase family 4 protein [Xylogone sp. PMI_703]|nr:glycosyltransferase family 4 protein [Xylogone sp. PMI_703]